MCYNYIAMPTGVYIRKPLTEEHKNNISNSLKGTMPTNFHLVKGWMKGKRHSPETIKKLRIAKLGKRGEEVNNWKGGRRIKDGYVFIYSPDHPRCSNTYVREHRLVMEKHLGRYLNPGEKVHHLGEKDDNRIQMLMVFTSQSAHLRFERDGKVKPTEIVFDGRKFKR